MMDSLTQRPILFIVLLIVSIFVLFNVIPSGSTDRSLPIKAVVVLKGESSVYGILTLEQASAASPVTIHGELSGLDVNAQRGLHVHEHGDTSNGCLAAGGHYNPFGKTHGAPEDKERHVGDLGNIKTDSKGVARVSIVDSQLTLHGSYSILGRAIVVHSGTDDLGRGDHADSKKTGNAGGRSACGVIGEMVRAHDSGRPLTRLIFEMDMGVAPEDFQGRWRVLKYFRRKQ